MPPANPVARHLHHCLTATPAVLRALLGALPADSDFWDLQPDPDRFTPREVLAHLADWNPIFRDRIALMLAEDHPTLPRIGEDRLPIEHDYASQDPLKSLDRFCAGRAELVEKVKALSEVDSVRVGRREDMGDITVADQVVLVAIHDAYHAREIAEYLEIWRGQSAILIPQPPQRTEGPPPIPPPPQRRPQGGAIEVEGRKGRPPIRG